MRTKGLLIRQHRVCAIGFLPDNFVFEPLGLTGTETPGKGLCCRKQNGGIGSL